MHCHGDGWHRCTQYMQHNVYIKVQPRVQLLCQLLLQLLRSYRYASRHEQSHVPHINTHGYTRRSPSPPLFPIQVYRPLLTLTAATHRPVPQPDHGRWRTARYTAGGNGTGYTGGNGTPVTPPGVMELPLHRRG